MQEYQARTTEITIVDGVSVDITVSGDESRSEKVLMDLKDRLGWIGAAYDQETPISQIDERPSDFRPLMTVNWESVFSPEDE